MREIKFRCWDEKFKKIRYDYFLKMDWPTTGERFEHGIVGPFMPFAGRWKNETEFDYFPMMQYIGLKDTNSKEIYESDIVICEWHWEKPHAIEWPEDYYDITEFGMKDSLTILGNIYENPELINE